SCSEDIIENKPGGLNNNNYFVSVVLNATIDNAIEPSCLQPSMQNAEIEVLQNTDKFQQTYSTKSSVDIRNLMLFQYDNTGLLIHTQVIGDLSSLTNIPIRLMKGSDHKIIFISNAKEIDWTDRSLIYSLDQIQKLQYNYTSITNDEEVPLIGSVDIPFVSENTRIPEVKLKRIAAKIIFNYSDTDAKYKVKHVSLMNIPSSMRFFNTDEDNIYPQGSTSSHTMHPIMKYAEDASTEMIWFMPINRRGNNGTASSLKDKTDKTAPSGQGQYASYLSVYCENNTPGAIIKDGVCSIYLGSNDPRNYNIHANNRYNIKTRFSGSEIPTEDPRVDGNIGNFTFEFDIIDDEVFQSQKIARLVMDVNGLQLTPSIKVVHVHGNKYRVEGSAKIEHRHNTLNHLSFRDSDNKVLSAPRGSKTFNLEGDVYRKIENTLMSASFSGLFCGLGNGSATQPYEVCSSNTLSNVHDLSLLNQQSNRYVKQVKDVDLQNRAWTPLPPLSLNFDGNYHQIANLNIQTNTDDTGLFASISKHNTIVKNVTISSGYVRGRNYVGSIAGRILEGATVENCNNYATVLGTDNVGGICGEFQSYKELSDCENHGDVTGVRYIGGIAGIYRWSVLQKCRNFGDITALSNGAGGIAGAADYDHQVIECSNRGKITGQSQVGGIEGYSKANKVIQSYNCGNIRASVTHAGGLIGESTAGGPEFHICYNHASINARGVSGGIAGKVNGTMKLYNVYHIGEIHLQGDDIAGGICGEAAGLEAYHGNYAACYTSINETFRGTFGHFAGITPNHNLLPNTYFLKDTNEYGAVGKGNQWHEPLTIDITDEQLRGRHSITADGKSEFILKRLNTSQNAWQQHANYFPHLKDL
ncbi:MAG TPA: hypothetical protein DCF91_13660, partial [Porphyromonadaceae bacterium]|nr:hypothetical protein [Porphyromonadaceae bacterium]